MVAIASAAAGCQTRSGWYRRARTRRMGTAPWRPTRSPPIGCGYSRNRLKLQRHHLSDHPPNCHCRFWNPAASPVWRAAQDPTLPARYYQPSPHPRRPTATIVPRQPLRHRQGTPSAKCVSQPPQLQHPHPFRWPSTHRYSPPPAARPHLAPSPAAAPVRAPHGRQLHRLLQPPVTRLCVSCSYG